MSEGSAERSRAAPGVALFALVGVTGLALLGELFRRAAHAGLLALAFAVLAFAVLVGHAAWRVSARRGRAVLCALTAAACAVFAASHGVPPGMWRAARVLLAWGAFLGMAVQLPAQLARARRSTALAMGSAMAFLAVLGALDVSGAVRVHLAAPAIAAYDGVWLPPWLMAAALPAGALASALVAFRHAWRAPAWWARCVPPLAVLAAGAALALSLGSGVGVTWWPRRAVELVDRDIMLAIPLFVLAGEWMAAGETSRRLVDFATALVGRWRAGLPAAAVLAAAGFAAMTGSSPVAVVAMGSITIPALRAQGHDEAIAFGLPIAAGSLGILIPPSVPMLLYALMAGPIDGTDARALFAAGVWPALCVVALWLGWISWRTRGSAPSSPAFAAAARSLTLMNAWRRAWPAALVPTLTLGGILWGVLTPTKAAVVTALLVAWLEVVVWRGLTPRGLLSASVRAAGTLGGLFAVLVFVAAFNHALVLDGLPGRAAMWVTTHFTSPWAVVLGCNVVLLAAGALMDIVGAILLFVPLLVPIAAAFGLDPTLFGVMVILNLEIGYLTPPVGLNLIVAAQTHGGTVWQAARATRRPLVALFVVLAVWAVRVALSAHGGPA